MSANSYLSVFSILSPAFFSAICVIDAATIEGTVVEDHSGHVQAHAKVRILVAATNAVIADLETDQDGSFRVDHVASGDYHLDVSKASYVNASLNVRAPQKPVLARLLRCGVITGQVFDERGEPVPGASVFAIAGSLGGVPDPTTMDRSFRNMARSDERGQYRLFDLPMGQYLVAVSFGGVGNASGSGVAWYPSNSQPKALAIYGGTEFRGVNIALSSGNLHRITGRVESPDPTGEYFISLINNDYPSLAVATTLTETHGHFHLEALPSGSYDILVSGPVVGKRASGALLGVEPQFGRVHITMEGQNVEDIGISIASGRSVSFIARRAVEQRNDPSCLEGATLTVFPIENWGALFFRTTVVQIGTTSRVDQLPDGIYRLHIAGRNRPCYLAEPGVITVNSERDQPVPIGLLGGGAVRGRLVGSGKPNALEILLASDDSAIGAVYITYPDATSSFAFDGIPPGPYWLTARPATPSNGPAEPAPIRIQVRGDTAVDVALAAVASNQEQ